MDHSTQPVVMALDNMLSHLFEQRTSDIHMEPKRNIALVRLQIDGVLHDVHVIPKIVYQAVGSRVKMLNRLNIAKKRRPQDGRIKRNKSGTEIAIPVSTMPTVFGEKAVLRIFDPDILLKSIEEIGFSSTELPHFTPFLANREDIILVTGDSGKTTTLYSVLKRLSRPELNLVTTEDPVELVYDDFNQVQIKSDIDVTFSNAIRNVLRQDPDIVMVGEIRDEQTAEMAIQAALKGHLFFKTLHPNDAPSASTRFLKLGAPPFLITGVLAQRLLRNVCTKCVEEYLPSEEDAIALKGPYETIKDFTFRRGRGCIRCRQPGHHGRGGVFEIMPVSPKIRKRIIQRTDAPEIVKTARDEGMPTLRESASQNLVSGDTTVAEVIRVTGSPSASDSDLRPRNFLTISLRAAGSPEYQVPAKDE
jgi:general secretion pathway protein E